MSELIKVLIVDDHKLISEAWSSLLKDALKSLCVELQTVRRAHSTKL